MLVDIWPCTVVRASTRRLVYRADAGRAVWLEFVFSQTGKQPTVLESEGFRACPAPADVAGPRFSFSLGSNFHPSWPGLHHLAGSGRASTPKRGP